MPRERSQIPKGNQLSIWVINNYSVYTKICDLLGKGRKMQLCLRNQEKFIFMTENNNISLLYRNI